MKNKKLFLFKCRPNAIRQNGAFVGLASFKETLN